MKGALSRIHPHDLWRQTYRLPDGSRTAKKWVAEKLAISTGHLSSIYKGDFRPSGELARNMAALTKGACTVREILEWHRKNPPVWERDKGPRNC